MLKLTKEGAQKLGAHLKQNNLLHSSTKFAFYRNREIQYVPFFTIDEEMCFCNNIIGLLNKIQESDDPSHWYLFMDSSSYSFKAILIHKTNLKVVPIAYSKIKKET